MRDISIRLATPSDAAQIAAIYRPYVLDTVISFETEPPTEEEMKKRIETIGSRFPYLVCEIDSRVAAYAYASAFKARIAYQWDVETSVYVRTDCHRMGIASALYACLLELLTALGYYNAYAIITTPNEKSEGLHRAFGFADAGVIHSTGYKLGQWLDVITMEKHLREFDGAPVPPRGIETLDAQIVCGALSKATARLQARHG